MLKTIITNFLNPCENILLYKHTYQAGKNTTVTENYFGVGTGAVMVLSTANLKKAFTDNHKFHDMLDTEIASECCSVKILRYLS